MQRRWSLYNKVEKLQIDDLMPDQVRAILLSIPTVKMKEWFACQEGDTHWQPLHHVEEFYEEVRMLKGNAIPKKEDFEAPAPKTSKTLESRPLFEEAPFDARTDLSLSVESTKVKERRSARRYPRHFGFKVLQGGKSFESETQDVSMSGISIAQELPSWVPKTFRAEIENSGKKVRILCSKVGDNKMRFMEADSWEMIKKWIVNG